MYMKTLQGFQLGLIQVGASLARVVVPLFLATTYQDLGLYYLVLVIVSFPIVALIFTTISYKKLVAPITN